MVAETEGGSEQDDVSFLRTVSIYHILIKNYSFKNYRKTWSVSPVQPQENEFAWRLKVLVIGIASLKT